MSNTMQLCSTMMRLEESITSNISFNVSNIIAKCRSMVHEVLVHNVDTHTREIFQQDCPYTQSADMENDTRKENANASARAGNRYWKEARDTGNYF